MVTKSSIIEGLYKSKDFNDCINKQEPADLRDDLRQDIIIIVMELPEDRLIALYLNKTLVYYVAKIISNQVRNPRNAFHKTYRNAYEELSNQAADDYEIEERQIRESMEDLADKAIEHINEVGQLGCDLEDAKSYFQKLVAIKKYYQVIDLKIKERFSLSKLAWAVSYPANWLDIFTPIEFMAWHSIRAKGGKIGVKD